MQRRSDLDRLEDLRWMAATGETLEGAAARLGLRVESLDRLLCRRDPELRRRFPRLAVIA